MLKKWDDDNCIQRFFVTLHPHLTTALSQQKIKIKMKDFAAIDFETANFERTSVCAVGVVVVRGGRKVDTLLLAYPSRTQLLQLPLLQRQWLVP